MLGPPPPPAPRPPRYSGATVVAPSLGGCQDSEGGVCTIVSTALPSVGPALRDGGRGGAASLGLSVLVRVGGGSACTRLEAVRAEAGCVCFPIPMPQWRECLAAPQPRAVLTELLGAVCIRGTCLLQFTAHEGHTSPPGLLRWLRGPKFGILVGEMPCAVCHVGWSILPDGCPCAKARGSAVA